MTDSPTIPKRIKLDDDIENMTKDDLLEKFKEQEKYIKYLEEKPKLQTEGGEDFEMKESEEKLKQQHIEAARRENTLVLRLTTKEQELQDYLNQIQEFKAAQIPTTNQLRSMLLDPAINLVFQHMAKEMEECKERQKQTQNELSAWKFTADSQTGKRLMAKCRMLLQENEDLGKLIASGRTAKLEGEIALEKTLVQEMKKNQADLDEFLAEIDEDVEGMQSMMYLLQQQLKESKEQITVLKEENKQLKMSVSKLSPTEDNAAAAAADAATSCNLQSSPQPFSQETTSHPGGNQAATSSTPDNESVSQTDKKVTLQRLQPDDDNDVNQSMSDNENVNFNGTTDANPVPISETSAAGINSSEECSQAQDVDSENHESQEEEKSENNLPPMSDQPSSTAEIVGSSDVEEVEEEAEEEEEEEEEVEVEEEQEEEEEEGGGGLTELVSSPSENQIVNLNPSDNSDVSNEAWSPKNEAEVVYELMEMDPCLIDDADSATEEPEVHSLATNKNTTATNSAYNDTSSVSLPTDNGTVTATSETDD